MRVDVAARLAEGWGRWCVLHVVWAWAPWLVAPALPWVSRWGTHQVPPRKAVAQGRCTPWAGITCKALGWGWDELPRGVSFLGESGYPLVLAVWLKLAWGSGGSGGGDRGSFPAQDPSSQQRPPLGPVGVFRTQKECRTSLITVRYLKGSWPLGSTTHPTCGRS